MSVLLTAIAASVQMMIIFFCAFLVIYLLAVLLLPLEKSLSNYIWAHSGHKASRPAKGSFSDFSKRHR